MYGCDEQPHFMSKACDQSSSENLHHLSRNQLSFELIDMIFSRNVR